MLCSRFVPESEMINEAPDDIAFHFCGAAGLRISPLDLDQARRGREGMVSGRDGRGAALAPRGHHGKLGEQGACLPPSVNAP